VKVGVKSTALILGPYVRLFTTTCAMLFVAMLAVAGVLNGQSPVFFAVSVGGTAAHIVWQYASVDLDSPESCGRACLFCLLLLHSTHGARTEMFIRNGYMGWITWSGLVLDYLFMLHATR